MTDLGPKIPSSEITPETFREPPAPWPGRPEKEAPGGAYFAACMGAGDQTVVMRLTVPHLQARE